MSISDWQKSSYSGNASNCVEVAAPSGEVVLIRESEDPCVVVTVSPVVLGGLVRSVRSDVTRWPAQSVCT
ncbi:DUF397 domain-containing protein [Streptomyces chrestomyceticus]|uniref:DUF397 domain-containing protein n=1 Tax=Streptomyces chrestomyceticus TaxID=68185 RepID=UPI0036BC5722